MNATVVANRFWLDLKATQQNRIHSWYCLLGQQHIADWVISPIGASNTIVLVNNEKLYLSSYLCAHRLWPSTAAHSVVTDYSDYWEKGPGNEKLKKIGKFGIRKPGTSWWLIPSKFIKYSILYTVWGGNGRESSGNYHIREGTWGWSNHAARREHRISQV